MRLYLATTLALCWLCQICVVQADENANNDYYTAGVVEISNELDRVENPKKYVTSNLEAYLHFIELAKRQNVDILVFPEATFNYLSSRNAMIEHGIVLPDPKDKIAPWKDTGYSEVLQLLSKKCKDLNMYVVINVVEKISCNTTPDNCKTNQKKHKDGYELYNTNIVFDRQGRLISKYQKFNLFVEPDMDEPVTAQLSTFSTDFNVEFGHFICFDILFKEPAMKLLTQKNITNVVYSSMWFSEIPFLTSTQIHQGWAYANNVNLISAGANNPIIGSSGSGIFIGRKKIEQILISPKFTTKLLTGRVPKDIRLFTQDRTQKLNVEERFSPVEMQGLHVSEAWQNQNVHNFDIDNNQTQEICAYEDICCKFNIKMKHFEIPPGSVAYKYKLVANYTARILGTERKCGELYCSIISCTTANPKSCGRRFKDNTRLFNAVEFEKIEIKAKIKYVSEDDILVMPNTLDTSILPLDTASYTFSSTGVEKQSGWNYKKFEIESRTKLRDIIAFGIYGRNFAADEFVPSKIIVRLL